MYTLLYFNLKLHLMKGDKMILSKLIKIIAYMLIFLSYIVIPCILDASELITYEKFQNNKDKYSYLKIKKLFELYDKSNKAGEKRKIRTAIILEQVFIQKILDDNAGGMVFYSEYTGKITSIKGDHMNIYDCNDNQNIKLKMDYNLIPYKGKLKPSLINNDLFKNKVFKLYALKNRIYLIEDSNDKCEILIAEVKDKKINKKNTLKQKKQVSLEKDNSNGLKSESKYKRTVENADYDQIIFRINRSNYDDSKVLFSDDLEKLTKISINKKENIPILRSFFVAMDDGNKYLEKKLYNEAIEKYSIAILYANNLPDNIIVKRFAIDKVSEAKEQIFEKVNKTDIENYNQSMEIVLKIFKSVNENEKEKDLKDIFYSDDDWKDLYKFFDFINKGNRSANNIDALLYFEKSKKIANKNLPKEIKVEAIADYLIEKTILKILTEAYFQYRNLYYFDALNKYKIVFKDRENTDNIIYNYLQSLKEITNECKKDYYCYHNNNKSFLAGYTVEKDSYIHLLIGLYYSSINDKQNEILELLHALHKKKNKKIIPENDNLKKKISKLYNNLSQRDKQALLKIVYTSDNYNKYLSYLSLDSPSNKNLDQPFQDFNKLISMIKQQKKHPEKEFYQKEFPWFQTNKDKPFEIFNNFYKTIINKATSISDNKNLYNIYIEKSSMDEELRHYNECAMTLSKAYIYANKDNKTIIKDKINKLIHSGKIETSTIKKLNKYGLEFNQKVSKNKFPFGMEFIFIKPGTFNMGSPESEDNRNKDENLHKVKLTKGFYMCATEVTQEQWDLLRKEYNNDNSIIANPSKNKCPQCPVENVPIKEIDKFIKKLNEFDNEHQYIYRLPTEAEWEYACRAGKSDKFHFGNYLPNDKANFDCSYIYNEINERCSQSHYQTKKVKKYDPNKFGLYDMHGNVRELCSDYYAPYQISGSTSDPKGPANGDYRVIRGGSYLSPAHECRCAFRGNSKKSLVKSLNILAIGTFSSKDMGFRLVAIKKERNK